MLVLTFATSTRIFAKYKTESAENYLESGGFISLARTKKGLRERG